MKKQNQKTLNKLRRLLTLVLVIIMATPSITFATEVTIGNPWMNQPEISPYGDIKFNPFSTEMDYNQSRLIDLLSRIHDFDNFTAEEQSLVSRHLGTYTNELAELSPEALEKILREQEVYWSTDWQIRETRAFFELLSSSVGFASLEEYNRNKIYRQLDIAYKAIDVTATLFVLMEQDGFSLSESVELMRIMSTGLFNYHEAQTILETMPDSRTRAIGLAQFEHFAQSFNINDQINEIRLVNEPFTVTPVPAANNTENWELGFGVRIQDTIETPKVLPNISAFLNTRSIDDNYSFINVAQQGVEGIYVAEYATIFEQPSQPQSQSEDPIQQGEDEREINNNHYPPHEEDVYEENFDEQHLQSEEYQALLLTSLGHSLFNGEDDDESKYKNYLEYPENPDDEINPVNGAGQPDDTLRPDANDNRPPYQPPVYEHPTAQRNQPTVSVRQYGQVELSLGNSLQSRNWNNPEQMTDNDWNIIRSISEAFTSEAAFDVARQLFLVGHNTREIRETFALGAALQVEPQMFLLQPGEYSPNVPAPLNLEYFMNQAPITRSVVSYDGEGCCSDYPHEVTFNVTTSHTNDHLSLVHDMANQTRPFDVRLVTQTINAQLRMQSQSQLQWQMGDDGLTNGMFGLSTNEVGEDELDRIIGYGLAIINFGMSPMADVPTPPPVTHENIVHNPFGLGFDANDSVSLNTGSSMFRQNILSLPGRGGFGLNLDLAYNSANAELLRPSGRHDPIFGGHPIYWGSTFHVTFLTEEFHVCHCCGPLAVFVRLHHNRSFFTFWDAVTAINQHEGLDVWSCCCMAILTVRQAWIARREEHWGNWWGVVGHTPVNYTQPRNDLIHGLGPGWTFDLPHILDNVLYLPGRGSFELNGNNFRDRTLQDMRLFSDGSFNSGNLNSTRRLDFHNGTQYFFHNELILGMRDRFGNTIRFEYANQPAFGNQRLLSRIIDTNGQIINFTYTTSGGNRLITVTSPDGSSYIITLTPIPGHGGMFQLANVQNQVGATTRFNYSLQNARFDFFTKTPGHANHALLLTQVTYPSGAQLRFEYVRHGANLGSQGSRQVFKVTAREMRQPLTDQVYQRTTFAYTRDATAFPQQVDRPPANHTYMVRVTQNNGLATIYTFNHHHLNTTQRTYNAQGALLSVQNIAYDGHRLPSQVQLTEHFAGRSRMTTQSFTNNQFGQVTQTVSPMAWGVSGGSPNSHERYRTTQTYDGRFGLPLVTAFWSDESTRMESRNTLTNDGRNVAKSYIYENGTRMSRTDFSHDNFGNITEIRSFPDARGSDFITTQIEFDRGTMPSAVRTIDIRDADGNLVSGSGIGGNGVIESQFAYDVMWRLVQETDPSGYVTRWTHDNIGRITRIDLPNGGFSTYVYNDTANTLTHGTVLGAVYVYTYDGFGNLRTITDIDGAAILSNAFDNRMRLVETRNAEGVSSTQATVFFYDIFDRVVDVRSLSPSGQIMGRETVAYYDVNDNQGNSRAVNAIHGNLNTQDTASSPNLTTTPDIISFTQHDRFGRLTQEGIQGGRVVNYDHDLSGRIVREQSLGINNHFSHNIHGVTSITNIENNTSYNTFDHVGRMATSSDFMGNVQRFAYDALGRIIRHDIPFEQAGDTTHYSSTKYFYDRNGNLTRTAALVNLPGQPEQWAYTANTFRYNNLISSITGGHDGFRTDWTYDLAGNILAQRVGGAGNPGSEATGGATTTFTYDSRGRLIQTTDALGQIEALTYDLNGLLSTRVDRNGTTFKYAHDNMGRLIRQEALVDGEVQNFRNYDFNSAGLLHRESTGHQNSNAQLVIYHAITYFYDAQGRVVRQEETGGVITTHTYNEANNITQTQIRIGGALHIDNAYTFDVAQRMNTVTSGGQRVATYAYSTNGMRISRTHNNDSIETTYTLNLANMVTSMYNRQGGILLSSFAYAHYLDGNVQKFIEESGKTDGSTTQHTTIYTYDLARRLAKESQRVSQRGESHTAISAMDVIYNFDNRGNRIGSTTTKTSPETGLVTTTTTHTHDLNNRLLTSTTFKDDGTNETVTTTTLTHDPNGNQLTQTTKQGEAPSLTPPTKIPQWQWINDWEDEWGIQVGFTTLVSVPDGTGPENQGDDDRSVTQTQTNTYNLFNQLVSVVVEDVSMSGSAVETTQTTASRYTYRTDGLRHSKTVSQTVNSTTGGTLSTQAASTTHVWNENHIVMELSQEGNIINRFYRGANGQLIRSYHHGWYIHNARGDVVVRVNDQGQVLHRYQYDAFGNELNPNQNNTNPFRFAGEYWDFETGTYYLRARHFNPRTGRFTQPDPFWNVHNMNGSTWAIMQAGNLFVYTMNNPVYWIDPSGLTAFTVRNALHHSNPISGRYTLYVRPRSADNFHFYAGFTPPGMISEVINWALGYREIDITWTLIQGVADGVGPFVPPVQIGVTGANIINRITSDQHMINEAIFNTFSRTSFNADTREEVAYRFNTASRVMTGLVSSGRVHVIRAVDHFGSEAFDSNGHVRVIHPLFSPSNIRQFSMNNLYFFPTDPNDTSLHGIIFRLQASFHGIQANPN